MVKIFFKVMYYTYCHVNKLTKEVFYVGYGSLKRANQITRIKGSYYDNYLKENNLTKNNIGICILHMCADLKEARDIENSYIIKFGYSIVNKGTSRDIMYNMCSIGGIKSNEVHRKNKTGFFADNYILQRSKNGIFVGNKTYQNKTGLFSLSKEQRILNGKKGGVIGGSIGGAIAYEKKLGIFARTKEQHSIDSIKGASKVGKDVGNRQSTKNRLITISKAAGMKKARKILCENDGKLFSCINDAARYYNIDASCITKVCKLKRKTVNKLVFRYERGD